LARERLLGRTVKRILDKLKGAGKKLDRVTIEEGVKNRKIKMDYENERLVLRGIASSTNERTLISCVVPAGVFLANSLAYIEPFNVKIENEISVIQKPIGDYIYYIQALLNSFVLDYYIRKRVSANLNFFFVYELPIPDVPEDLLKAIINKSKQLIDNDDLTLRVELEALIAGEIFNLNLDEMKIILDSFIYGNIDETLKNEILKKMKTHEM
jgi:hypothetical protein